MTVTISEKLKVHTVYKNREGIRIPSVTTYLSILNKPALLAWAWTLGTQGIDYKAFRDNAADIGTLAHAIVVHRLAGETMDYSEYSPADVEKAQVCVEKYVEWERGHDIEPLILEEPLISEEHQFGGTIDCYALVDSIPTLLDFKTSKGIFDEMAHQVAAYRHLLIENGYIVESVQILRIGKSPEEGFEVKEIKGLDKHFDLFLACQKIYELQKQLRKGG